MIVAIFAVMRELCQTHNLVIAADGKCVLCRRPPARLFAVREEHETLISRVFTGLLGVCLVAALGALIYMSQLDGGYRGGKYVPGPVALGQLSARQQQLLQQALQEDRQSTETSGAVDAGAATAQDAAAPAVQPASVQKSEATAAGKPATTSAVTKAAAPSAPVAVTMYATPWCFICDRARDFLLARNVELTEYDVDRDREAERRLKKGNPSASLPTFEIAGRTHVGFNPWELEDALRSAAVPSQSARAH
jgi:glutaredoxin